MEKGNHEKRIEYEGYLKSWVDSNIFNNELPDAITYLVLYIAVPVIVTAVSLYTKTNKGIDSAYFYITVMITASNCFYDAANRRERGKKSVKNTKIVIICSFVAIVAGYSLIELFMALLSKTTHHYPDWILCFYFGAVLIAVVDFIVVLAPLLAFREKKLKDIKNTKEQKTEKEMVGI